MKWRHIEKDLPNQLILPLRIKLKLPTFRMTLTIFNFKESSLASKQSTEKEKAIIYGYTEQLKILQLKIIPIDVSL